MTPLTFVLLSGALSFGIPLAIAIRELILLSRFRRGGDEPPPEPRFPAAPRPLPSCLLPPPTPAGPSEGLRVRELEDA